MNKRTKRKVMPYEIKIMYKNCPKFFIYLKNFFLNKASFIKNILKIRMQ